MKFLSSDIKKKIGGTHTTIIGGRYSYKIINIILKHEKIKNIIPSIICYKKKTTIGGFEIKVQRPDSHGNLRLLIIDGSSYQELRLITTVSDEINGAILKEELNELIKIKK